MREVTIYTDGACSGNPGPGGWAAVLLCNGRRKEIHGGEMQTTNNRMELMAVVAALECLQEPCEVYLYSDSTYIINSLQKGWAESWKKRGWMRGKNEPALNSDLWSRVLSCTELHDMHYFWVKGHSTSKENNRCDELAASERDKYVGLSRACGETEERTAQQDFHVCEKAEERTRQQDFHVCDMCHGKMFPSIVDHVFQYDGQSVVLRGLPVYRCEKCGSIIYTAEEAKKIEQLLDKDA